MILSKNLKWIILIIALQAALQVFL